MLKTLLPVATAASILVFASPGMAAGGKAFMTKAIQGNLAEISMGQLAAQNGASQEVKSFGQMLVTDHTAANQNATAAATQLGLTPPDQPTKKDLSEHDRMAKLTGDKFDSAFKKHMIADHKKDIAEYKKEAKAKKPDAATSYAQDTLPTLEKHLQTAQSLPAK